MHVDEMGVGHLLESTVRACRSLNRRGYPHLKLGIVGEELCSDPTWVFLTCLLHLQALLI